MQQPCRDDLDQGRRQSTSGRRHRDGPLVTFRRYGLECWRSLVESIPDASGICWINPLSHPAEQPQGFLTGLPMSRQAFSIRFQFVLHVRSRTRGGSLSDEPVPERGSPSQPGPAWSSVLCSGRPNNLPSPVQWVPALPAVRSKMPAPVRGALAATRDSDRPDLLRNRLSCQSGTSGLLD